MPQPLHFAQGLAFMVFELLAVITLGIVVLAIALIVLGCMEKHPKGRPLAHKAIRWISMQIRRPVQD